MRKNMSNYDIVKKNDEILFVCLYKTRQFSMIWRMFFFSALSVVFCLFVLSLNKYNFLFSALFFSFLLMAGAIYIYIPHIRNGNSSETIKVTPLYIQKIDEKIYAIKKTTENFIFYKNEIFNIKITKRYVYDYKDVFDIFIYYGANKNKSRLFSSIDSAEESEEIINLIKDIMNM